MPFSPDVEHVLEYLEGYSPQGLHKRHDLGSLLDLAAGMADDQTMNALIFNGTLLCNLYSTLRKTPTGAEGYQILQNEFSAATGSVRSMLAELLSGSDDEQFLTRCQTHYYAATQGALRNLIDLCTDLAVLKRLQNDMRRRG